MAWRPTCKPWAGKGGQKRGGSLADSKLVGGGSMTQDLAEKAQIHASGGPARPKQQEQVSDERRRVGRTLPLDASCSAGRREKSRACGLHVLRARATAHSMHIPWHHHRDEWEDRGGMWHETSPDEQRAGTAQHQQQCKQRLAARGPTSASTKRCIGWRPLYACMRACIDQYLECGSAGWWGGRVGLWICSPVACKWVSRWAFCGTGLAWSNRECLRHPDRRSVLWFFCLYARLFAREPCCLAVPRTGGSRVQQRRCRARHASRMQSAGRDGSPFGGVRIRLNRCCSTEICFLEHSLPSSFHPLCC